MQRDKPAHCDKLFEETRSGASGERPRLSACLEYVREGDTLVATRLASDRRGVHAQEGQPVIPPKEVLLKKRIVSYS